MYFFIFAIAYKLYIGAFTTNNSYESFKAEKTILCEMTTGSAREEFNPGDIAKCVEFCETLSHALARYLSTSYASLEVFLCLLGMQT